MDELFDAKALQEFILIACQDMIDGGLRDKPGKLALGSSEILNFHAFFISYLGAMSRLYITYVV